MNQTTYLQQREGETIPELAKRIAEAHQAMRNPQPEIISRAEAKAQGLKHYFTGKPCSKGGIATRYVSSGNCACDKCREENREAAYAIISRWRGKNRETLAERQRRYREENREAVSEYNRRYREENCEAIAERHRRWREKNREYVAEQKRRNYEENKEAYLAYAAHRRAAKRQAIPSWFSEFDEFAFQQAYELAAERQKETGIEWHVDHMIPLLARKCCGLHCAENIQVIPAVMNLEKQNKMQLTKQLEWLR